MGSRRRALAAAVVALDAVLVLLGQTRDLTTIDDCREAEVAREMWESGDFVIPTLAGQPFLEKPPGFPAVVATLFRVTGPGVVAARLVSAAFALAALAAAFLAGRRAFGLAGGVATASALALATLFVRTSHEILLDNALVASTAFALHFAWKAFDGAEPGAKRRAYALAGFSLGIGFLFKGLVGPAIFAAGFAPFLVFTRRWSELRHAPLALLAFLLPAAAWAVPFLLRATPDQRYEFFVSNHFGRAARAYASHDRPPWFYLETIWYRFAPGAVVLPFAVFRAFRTKDAALRYALFGALGPMLLLSVSRAKDAVYLLPAYPALALLVGGACARAYADPTRFERFGLALGAAAAAVVAGAANAYSGFPVSGVAGVLAGATAVVFAIVRSDRALQGAALSGLLAVAGSHVVTGRIAELDEAKHAGWRPGIRAVVEAADDRAILLYGPDDRMRGALGFYRNRTAREEFDPATLIDALVRDGQAWLVLAGEPPPELIAAAASKGVALREEFRARYFDGWLLAFRAAW